MRREEAVFAAPFEELAVKNAKGAKNCLELHLANRNISRLSDFDKFLNLDTLWLNGNRLSSLEGLEMNFRLKNLFLHTNRFKTIVNQGLDNFSFLHQLTLNDNKLDDLEATIQELKQLRHLRVLNLYDNPIAQEDNYRMRVLCELAELDIFDRHQVTEEERRDAKTFKKRMAKLGQLKSTVRKPLMTPREAEAHRFELNDILDRMRKAAKSSRTFLEESFTAHDKRNLGIIDEGIFWQILSQYGISQALSQQERDFITEEYKCPLQVISISKTGTLPRNGVNYRKFCNQLLPSFLRTLPDNFHFEMVPEVSTISADLANYVKKNEREKKKQEEHLRKTSMLALSAPTTQERVLSPRSRVSESSHGLTPWLTRELYKLFEPFMILSTTDLNRVQLKDIFKKFTSFGKIPVCGIRSAIDLLLKSGETVPLLVARAAMGCSITSSELLSIPNTYDGIKIKFRDINFDETEDLERNLFSEATGHLEVLLRAGSCDWDPFSECALGRFSLKGPPQPLASTTEGKISTEDTTSIRNQSMRTSINATRLAAKKTARSVEKSHWLPHEVVAGAKNRSDYAVLPNLGVPSKYPESFDVNTWTSHLSSLGLKGETLEAALLRKSRSVSRGNAQGAGSLSMSTRESTTAGANSSLPSKETIKMSTSNRHKKINHLPKDYITTIPAYENYPKGWNNLTGTLVIGKQ